jgi:hypothetical protein
LKIFFARWNCSARYKRECPQCGSDGQQMALLFFSHPQVATRLGDRFVDSTCAQAHFYSDFLDSILTF